MKLMHWQWYRKFPPSPYLPSAVSKERTFFRLAVPDRSSCDLGHFITLSLTTEGASQCRGIAPRSHNVAAADETRREVTPAGRE